MAPRIMVVWVLMLQMLWAGVYVMSFQYFTPRDRNLAKIAALEKKLHHRDREEAQLRLAFNEFKDAMVASGIRIQDNTGWSDPKRMIASVIADSDFKPHVDLATGTHLQKAKKYFAAGNYQRAAEHFDDFIQNSAGSPNIPEAMLLLSESYLQSGQVDSALKTMDQLITHFPETEYTAYALVRLGKIFDQESRPEVAAEMFHVVINEYPKTNAATIASRSLKDLAL